MKTYVLVLFAILLITACNSSPTPEEIPGREVYPPGPPATLSGWQSVSVGQQCVAEDGSCQQSGYSAVFSVSPAGTIVKGAKQVSQLSDTDLAGLGSDIDAVEKSYSPNAQCAPTGDPSSPLETAITFDFQGRSVAVVDDDAGRDNQNRRQVCWLTDPAAAGQLKAEMMSLYSKYGS